MAVDDSFTKSLLHFDGADESTTFTDESGKTWTAHGDAKLSTTNPKFGIACGVFDGTGDWVDTPDSADFTMGTGDFTVDFCLKRAVINSSRYVVGQCDSGTGNASFLSYFNVDNTISFYVERAGGSYTVTSTGTITDTTTWHHIAFVRDGVTFRLFIDGVANGTATIGANAVKDSSNNLSIGRAGEFDALYFNGRVDEFRLSQGIARWTSDFTPPTQPYAPGVITVYDLEVATEIDTLEFSWIDDLEVVTEIDSLTVVKTVEDLEVLTEIQGSLALSYWYYDQYNVVLLHCDGVDESTTFLDRSGKPWTAYGDAQIDTSQKKFGSGSGLFDGNDAISTPFHTDFIFYPYYTGMGMDFWIMFHGWPSLGTSCVICNQHDNAYPQNYWRLIFINTVLGDKLLHFEVQNIDYDYAYARSQNYAFQLDTWYHIAFSIDGTGKFFIAGVDKTLYSTSFQAVDPICVNGDFVVGGSINGQIDEFSVDKIARYWSAFTPPTAQYGDGGLTISNLANLEVLINMDSVVFVTPPGVLKVDGITGWANVCGIPSPSKVSGMAAS